MTYADANFNSSTLAAANITLNKTGTANGTLGVSGTGLTRTVTISGVTGDGSMGISIVAGTASDLAGNLAPAAGPSTAFIVDNTPPTAASFSPSPGSTNIPANTNLVVNFSENMAKGGSGNIVVKKAADNSVAATIPITSSQVTVSNAQATIVTSVILAPATGYYVLIDAGAFQDLAGNAFSGVTSTSAWSFTTANVTLTPSSLPSGIVGVAYSQTISATGGVGNKTLTYSITAGSIPAGLTISPASPATNSITISGTPTVVGTFTLHVSATDTLGTKAAGDYTVAVNQSPAITSADHVTFAAGNAGTFQVNTVGFPIPTLTESGSLPGGVTFKDNGNGTATLAGTPGVDASTVYSLTITAHNGIGSDAVQNFTLTVNHSPTVVTAASATPNPVTTTQTSLYVLGADIDTGEASLKYTWTATALPSGAAPPTFSVNGSNAAKSATVTFSRAGTYGFMVTIADPSGLSTTSSVSVIVNQVVAHISVTPAIVTIGPGATQQFSATANDQFGNSLTPQPTFTWTTTVGSITTGGLLTAPVVSASGTVKASSGAVSGTANVTVLPPVNVAFVMSDPLLPGKLALYVYGTAGNDVILVNPGSDPGSVTVLFNGQSRGTFSPTGRIIVHGLAGNDYIGVSSQITLPAWLYGDDGNDVLWGGGGPNLLFGGAGNDTLYSGKGRNLLIGGAGSDLLTGGAGDALLIGGTTAYDANDLALAAIMNEWNSNAGCATRVGHLTGRRPV